MHVLPVRRTALDFRNQLFLIYLAGLPFLVCGLEGFAGKALLRVIEKFEVAVWSSVSYRFRFPTRRVERNTGQAARKASESEGRASP